MNIIYPFSTCIFLDLFLELPVFLRVVLFLLYYFASTDDLSPSSTSVYASLLYQEHFGKCCPSILGSVVLPFWEVLSFHFGKCCPSTLGSVVLPFWEVLSFHFGKCCPSILGSVVLPLWEVLSFHFGKCCPSILGSVVLPFWEVLSFHFGKCCPSILGSVVLPFWEVLSFHFGKCCVLPSVHTGELVCFNSCVLQCSQVHS